MNDDNVGLTDGILVLCVGMFVGILVKLVGIFVGF